MAVYSVSYDLNKTGQNYDGLIKEIESFNGYAKVMKSHWMVCHNGTANDVYEKLKKHLDSNDHILIMEASKNFQCWLPKNKISWLDKHL
ncbi:hypothetical protein WH285_00690 [Acinetobacter johnsonii]|uniref:hypothetical protein n=1 Tax=Acinetobacter johnsonii TaxID=40214 RepID=UPI0030AF400D